MANYAWKHGLCANFCGSVDCCLCWNTLCCGPVTVAQFFEASGKMRSGAKCLLIAAFLLLCSFGYAGAVALFVTSDDNPYIALGHQDAFTCPYYSGCLCYTTSSLYKNILIRYGESCPSNIIGVWIVVAAALALVFQIVIFCLSCCARMRMREKHSIVGNCCEDCCCSMFCQPCVHCQGILQARPQAP